MTEKLVSKRNKNQLILIVDYKASFKVDSVIYSTRKPFVQCLCQATCKYTLYESLYSESVTVYVYVANVSGGFRPVDTLLAFQRAICRSTLARLSATG